MQDGDPLGLHEPKRVTRVELLLHHQRTAYRNAADHDTETEDREQRKRDEHPIGATHRDGLASQHRGLHDRPL